MHIFNPESTVRWWASSGTPTYRISTYDPGDSIDDPSQWRVRAIHQDLMRLRWWIRTLRALGYEDHFSIYVSREEDE